jgi:hypothetical protein
MRYSSSNTVVGCLTKPSAYENLSIYGKGQKMGAIPRILYSEECEREIKERWPDRCPECGCVAYLGLNQYSCVNTYCRHGSEKESNDYHELLDADEKKHPGNQLKLPDIDELTAKGAFTTGASIVNHFYPTPSVFDWRQHVENSQPIHDNGRGEWTYQLPVNESGACCIGDQLVSSNGITYCICKMDRFSDQITLCWDKRVAQP